MRINAAPTACSAYIKKINLIRDAPLRLRERERSSQGASSFQGPPAPRHSIPPAAQLAASFPGLPAPGRKGGKGWQTGEKLSTVLGCEDRSKFLLSTGAICIPRNPLVLLKSCARTNGDRELGCVLVPSGPTLLGVPQVPFMGQLCAAVGHGAAFPRTQDGAKTGERIEKEPEVYFTDSSKQFGAGGKVLLCVQARKEGTPFVGTGSFKGFLPSPELAAALGRTQPIVSVGPGAFINAKISA